MPRAVLFDFGYTLFAHHPLADTIVAAGTDLGQAISAAAAAALAEEIDRLAHLPDELVRGRDLDAGVWRDRFHTLYAVADERHPGLGRQIYRKMHDPAGWIPFPATVATLRAVRRLGVAVGVVSNTGWDIRTVFAHHGLSELIDHFSLSCEVGAVKPDRRIFAAALDALDVDAAEAVMVGDDPVADAGAQRCGLTTVLLPLRPPGEDNGLGRVVGLLEGSTRADADAVW